MKLLITGKSKPAFISLAAGLALMMITGAAMAGIANTKHNLVSATATNNRFTATNLVQAEICVFCHTPHGANTNVQAPLWNKGASAATSYNLYNTGWSNTMDSVLATDGSAVSGGAIGSNSLACLSCHDGTQAMNNMINQPGSGGWDSTMVGANLAGSWTAGTSTPTPVTAAGLLGNGIGNLGLPGAGTTVDLRNDHPIGIQYCGGGTPGVACNDPDFFLPKSATIGGQVVFWVGASATRTKTQMILYNRTFPANPVGGAGGTYPSVECATCHDPHVDGTGGSGPTFLRVANTASALCLACHNK